ncbi:MAG: hypothetical protein RR197_00680 [Oscillospiraceae bacterium]
MFQQGPQQALASLWDGGRFPHALLLEGACGSGKRTLALRAAALLLCRGEKPPCGDCLSCRKLEHGNHPDLTLVEPAGKTKSIGVDVIRALRADAYVTPHESSRRVFLIPNAQTMTVQSQNALLKLIEEPPAPAFFVLTALSRGGLLETVRSRVTLLVMDELSAPQRLEALTALRPEADPVLLRVAAEGADTVGQALAALEDPGAQQRFADAQALLDAALALDRYTILALLSGYEKDREGLLGLLETAKTAAVSRIGADSALQILKIVAIIEETMIPVRQNVGLPLVSAVFAGRVTRL